MPDFKVISPYEPSGDFPQKRGTLLWGPVI